MCYVIPLDMIFGFSLTFSMKKKGFFESFYKLISTHKRNDKWYFIILRLSLFISTLYLCYYVYTFPTVIDDTKDHLIEIYHAIHEWGVGKIINNGTTVSTLNKHDEHIRRIIDEGIDD